MLLVSPSDNLPNLSMGSFAVARNNSAEVSLQDLPSDQKVHERLRFIKKGAQRFEAFHHLENILRDNFAK